VEVLVTASRFSSIVHWPHGNSAGVSARPRVGLGQVRVRRGVVSLGSGAVELVQPLSCCARARPALPSNFFFRVDFCVHKNIEWIKWYFLLWECEDPLKRWVGNAEKMVRPALDPEHKLGPLNKPRIYFLYGPYLNRVGFERMFWFSRRSLARSAIRRDQQPNRLRCADGLGDGPPNQHVRFPSFTSLSCGLPVPRLGMALPAFTRATDATWMEKPLANLELDRIQQHPYKTWRSATRLLRGGRQLQCSMKRAVVPRQARFGVVYATSVSWYARHSVCAVRP
jgi:hypothetical protein